MIEHIFRANFGVSSFLKSKLWDLFQPIYELHIKYWPQYLFWTLLFLKHYNTDNETSNIWVLQSKHIANGYDLPMIKLQVKPIKLQIHKKRFFNHDLFISIIFFRLFLPNGSIMITKVSVSCWLMAQSFSFLNLHHFIEIGSPTSSTALLFNMRLLSQSKGAKCFGLMDPFLQASSVMSASFAIALSICFQGRS